MNIFEICIRVTGLLEVFPENNIFLKKFNSEFQDMKLRFPDQNGQPLEIEGKVNLNLVIKYYCFLKK